MSVVLAMTTAQPVYAGFDEAVKAYEAGDYKTAFDEWKPLAEDNDPAAMRNLGHLYRKGLGVPQDYNKAFSWYKRAAEMGFRRAQANVASMYLKGQGIDQDYVKAAEWFTRAAQNGHVISQYNLGLMYEFGKGVEKSKAKALAWYNLAAKAGHAQALNKMSTLVVTKPEIKEEAVSTKEKATEAPPVAIVEPAPKQVTPPVKVTKVEPKPAAKQIVPPKKVTTPKPSVSENPQPSAPAKQAIAKGTNTKKFDPFASSANNSALKGNVEAAGNTKNTGAPTAFNQKTVAAKEVAPTRVVVEPPKLASEIVVKKPEPVKQAIVTKEPEETVVSKEATPTPEPMKQAELVKSSEPALADQKPDSAVESKSAKSTVAPATTTVVAAEKSSTPQPAEESKGFFSSLKSLIIGDEEKEPEPKTDNTDVANAPTPAVPTPVPAEAPVQVTTGAGLSVAERLEMATLSYELQEYHQALSVWASLAREGNAAAQYNLGNMFSDGLAVPVDRVRAYYWWQKASAGGHKDASSALAKLEKSLTFLEKKQIQNIN